MNYIYKLISISLIFVAVTGFAETSEDDEWRHKISFEVGESVQKKTNMKHRLDYNFEKNLFQIKYSQPNKFFRIDGTRDLIGGIYPGYNTNLYNFYYGLSQTVNIFRYRKLYFNFSFGAIYGSIKTTRLHSRFSLTWSIEAGLWFNNFTIGLAKTHFSNGDLRLPNCGENFFGLRASYHF